MSKYDIQTYDIPVESIKSTWTDKERNEYNSKIQLLKKYGIDISLYTNNMISNVEHPDGIHNYRQDSYTAMQLVLKENKELPDNLKERLLYYKSIMDKEEI